MGNKVGVCVWGGGVERAQEQKDGDECLLGMTRQL